MIRTVGAAIGVLIIVLFMADIATHLGSADQPTAVASAAQAVKR